MPSQMKPAAFFSHATAVALVSALGLACASTPVPHERLASASGAIRAAEETGADKVPTAALYLKLAKEGIERSQKLIKSDDNHRATLVLERAEADADLALSLAREAPLRAEAQKASEDLQAIKSQHKLNS